MSETADQSLQGVEYTLDWYRGFLDRLRSDGYRFQSFDDHPAEGAVLLRHDVDLSVDAALAMARVEADLGVQSTYFFLLSSPLYNVFERETREQIAAIRALGHDVGVHFSTHAYWASDEQPLDAELAKQIRGEQAALATVTDPVSAVSFHIPPEWVLGRQIPEVRSAYEPALFTDIDYVADSSGRWREQHPLDGGLGETVQILTHPGLWGETDASFDDRIEAAIAGACDRSRALTRAEFLARNDDV